MQADTYINSVLAKCSSLQDSHFWPPEPRIRPRAWLTNFPPDDQLAAAVLLDNFVFYADHLTDRLLRAAMAPVAQLLTGRDKTIQASIMHCDQLLRLASFTPVEGEAPSPADSGNLVCRKIRQLFELPGDVIATPTQAVERALTGIPVVLVDDFLGSGNQVVDQWHRSQATPEGPTSLADAYARHPFACLYVCLGATSLGLGRLRTSVPIQVCCAHEIGPEYDVRNLTNPNLLRWFPDIKIRIARLLSLWAPRLQLPDYMRTGDFAEYGFHSLGLMLGFEHSPCPDATLPIYWARTADATHTPLVLRTHE